MKKILSIIIFAMGISLALPLQAAVEVGAKEARENFVKKFGLQIQDSQALSEQTAEEFLSLTPKKIKAMTGKRLSLKETVGLKIAQKKLKKQMEVGDGTADGPKSQWVALLLCWFLGGLGIHRLYLGYKNWWLMLITLGGCGIWALIDLIRIITGDMKPADGSKYDPSF